MTPLFHSVLTSCLIATGGLLLFFHIHAERESFQRLQAFCSQALRYAKTLSVQLCNQPEAEYQKKAVQIRHMMDEARVQNFKICVRFSLIGTAVMVLFSLQHQVANRYSGMVVWILIMYATGLFAAYSQVQWTPTKMSVITTLVNFMMLVRTCIIEDQGVWFLNSNGRVLTRLAMGVLDMDHRRIAMWNFLFFFANTIKTAQMSESLPTLQRPISSMMMIEGSVFVVVWIFVYTAQMWVKDCVQTAFEASASRIDKTMTDHLLSAFCDVQVKLGPNLELVGPHEKLIQILQARAPIGHELPHCISFLDYVAGADKARFKAFIGASSVSSGRCASTPSEDLYERPKMFPSAIHVHLRDSSGRHFPASIFHSAAMIADGESNHLIGMCVGSPEEFTETQEAPVVSPEAQQVPRDVVEQANQDGQADQDHHSQAPCKKKSSSLYSGSSSSSSRSKKSIRLVDLPVIDRVSISFDPFKWSIRKVCWNLTDDDQHVPSVTDGMLQPEGGEFRSWVQDQVNSALFAGNENSDQERQSALYGSMALALPHCFHTKKQIIISAKFAWLDLEDLDEVDDDELALVSLHLEGVKQISDTDRLKACMATISE